MVVEVVRIEEGRRGKRRGFRQGAGEPPDGGFRASPDGDDGALGISQGADGGLALEGFGEVAEVEEVVVEEGVSGGVEDGRGEGGSVSVINGTEAVGEGGEEAVAVDPAGGDQQMFVETPEGFGISGEVGGDFGEVAAEEGLAQGDGLEEGESEPFRDGGGEEVGAVAEPGFVGRGGVWGGREAVDHVEGGGKAVIGGEAGPLVVDGAPFGVLRGEGKGEGGVGRGEAGEEAEFAKVLAADSADRVEDGAGRPGGAGGAPMTGGRTALGKRLVQAGGTPASSRRPWSRRLMKT